MTRPPTPRRGAGTPPPRVLPERASADQLRKQAKDLLRDARSGQPAAVARVAAIKAPAPGERITLATAQLAIARELGFASWPKLVRHVESAAEREQSLRALIRPAEMTPAREWTLADGTMVPADDVYSMFVAAREGDVRFVRRLVERTSGLATVEYNYTPPIHFAVREGHREIAELLLDRGADPTHRSYPFQESLLMYAEDRGHEEVAALLRTRLARRFALAPGTQAIIAASGRGDVAAVEAELGREPGLARSANDTGDTALHHAAKGGHVAVVRVLIEADAQVDAVRGDGYRPMHCALMPNWFFSEKPGARAEIADLLLASGARKTIFVAAMRGESDFVRDALAHDSSLANFEDSCHHRVLSAAVRRGDAAMTRRLLEHGADPTLPEEGAPRGLSLWIAVNDGNHELIRLLLGHGADPNGPVESSGTPMLIAARDPELTRLLAAHGGRVRSSPRDQAARLIDDGKIDEAEAFLRGHPEWIRDEGAGWGDGIMAGPARDGRNDILAMLMRLGARVPAVSKWAPFYYFKHEATAEFLLDHGMDANHMNWHRFTLLHHMAASGEVMKARLLLAHGAPIDAIDEEYRSTPLGVAARWGQEGMVDLLLAHGADPRAMGAAWAAPLVWAERKGHARVSERLRRALAEESS